MDENVFITYAKELDMLQLEILHEKVFSLLKDKRAKIALRSETNIRQLLGVNYSKIMNTDELCEKLAERSMFITLKHDSDE